MAMTDFVAYDPIGVGNLYTIDSTQKWPLGQRCKAKSVTYGEAELVYLKGVASTVEGSVVTYDEAGITTLLVANAQGPIAVSLTANTAATTFSWYAIRANKIAVDCAASSGDNADLGYEGAAGQVGDGRAAGDGIANMMARSDQDGAATGFAWVQMIYPYVDDFIGA
jgi:hypothetical protein